MSDSDSKREWVRRVLGVEVGAAGGAAFGGKALPVWMAAKEQVDAGIAQLQSALRDTGDADLRQIAEYGLNGATDGQSVRLMAALTELDGAGPKGRDRAAAAVQAFRDFLDDEPIVDLIEGNPFGVTVPMRAALGGALDQIERSIGSS